MNKPNLILFKCKAIFIRVFFLGLIVNGLFLDMELYQFLISFIFDHLTIINNRSFLGTGFHLLTYFPIIMCITNPLSVMVSQE